MLSKCFLTAYMQYLIILTELVHGLGCYDDIAFVSSCEKKLEERV